MPRRLAISLKRFRARTEGSLSAEAVLVLPLLVWAYIGLFTLFDAFRVQNLNVKASYTIGDLLSRETNYVTPDYIEGLLNVYRVMTQAQHQTILRVTAIRYDADDDEHILLWSHSTPGRQAVTENTLDDILDHVPVMADADTVTVVETVAGFVPLFNIGIEPLFFENTVVTRPRFAPQIVWRD